MDKFTEAVVSGAEVLGRAPLTGDVERAATFRVIDTLGCALGGLNGPAPCSARAVAVPAAGGGSSLWGEAFQVAPDFAAFANGVATRYLDYNDSYRGPLSGGHPSDNVAGLLAVAEVSGASGAEFLRAMSVMYQVHMALDDCVPTTSRGWDQPVTGCVAAAIGAGVLLGLDHEQMGHACALAIVPGMALHETRVGELSAWKAGAGPMGSRQGVLAAQLAKHGMTGPAHPFEGVNGMWAAIGAPSAYPEVVPAARSRWGIERTLVKRWPVRDSCQLAADLAVAAYEDGVRVSEIEACRVETYSSAYRSSVEAVELWKPGTRETADHSMPCTVALGLAFGDVGVASFEHQLYATDLAKDVLRRLSIVVNDSFDRDLPRERRCRLSVSLSSGKIWEREATIEDERLGSTLSADELEDKFVTLAAPVLGEQSSHELLERLWTVATATDLSYIGAAMGMRPVTPALDPPTV